MFMFGMITFMFALGIIALVMATAPWCQWMKSVLAGHELGPSFFNISAVWETITRLMVRFNVAILLSA